MEGIEESLQPFFPLREDVGEELTGRGLKGEKRDLIVDWGGF